MKIVVTGGAGFIGSALCLHLINKSDHQIVNVDALTYAANLSSLDAIKNDPRYSFIRADITNDKAVREMLEHVRPDAIIHLAAESHVDRSIDNAGNFIQTNVLGTFNLLEAARLYWSQLSGDKKNRFRLLNVSTDEVYGSLGQTGFFKETTAYNPSSPYAASKAAADHIALAYYRTYGFPVLISNCCNNYGPRQFPEKLIPLMIIRALNNQSLPVYGDGLNIRDWLYVEDHARALDLILQNGRPGEHYNVGARHEVSNLEVVQQICAILDNLRSRDISHGDLISHVEDRPGHDRRYGLDPSRLENELGWQAQVDFDTGLAKTVNWYLENKSWWQPLLEQVAAQGGAMTRQGLIQQGENP